LAEDGRELEQVAEDRAAVAKCIDRCRREIAEVEELLRAGHPDLQGLCLALADWSSELRLIHLAQTKKGTGSSGARPS
jgi:hypothetical protein